MKKILTTVVFVMVLTTLAMASAEVEYIYVYSQGNNTCGTICINEDNSGYVEFTTIVNDVWLTLTTYVDDLSVSEPEIIHVVFTEGESVERSEHDYRKEKDMSYAEFLKFVEELQVYWQIEGEYYSDEEYFGTVRF